MKKRNVQVLASGIVNAVLTVLYLIAIILTAKRVSFTIGSGENELLINFVPLTPARSINWIVLFLLSAFVTASIFSSGFKKRWVKILCAVVAAVLAVLEFIAFLGPIVYSASNGFSTVWSPVSTVEMIIALLRFFVAATCIVTAVKNL